MISASFSHLLRRPPMVDGYSVFGNVRLVENFAFPNNVDISYIRERKYNKLVLYHAGALTINVA